MSPHRVRVLHISDIHFGHSHVEAHVTAVEKLVSIMAASDFPLDAIVISGDLSQRAREPEFAAARALIGRFQKIAPTVTVSGNHDAQWWNAPFGVGDRSSVHERWNEILGLPLEPTLYLPRLTIVGLNSAPGIMPWTLTANPRDLRVKGGLTEAQLADATKRLEGGAHDALRILLFHHNLVRGKLSNRWGLARPHQMLERITAIGPDVVCNGHDHEERAEIIESSAGATIVSTANTLSRRVRGKRVSSINIIEAGADTMSVAIWHFDSASSTFSRKSEVAAPRRSRAKPQTNA